MSINVTSMSQYIGCCACRIFLSLFTLPNLPVFSLPLKTEQFTQALYVQTFLSMASLRLVPMLLLAIAVAVGMRPAPIAYLFGTASERDSTATASPSQLPQRAMNLHSTLLAFACAFFIHTMFFHQDYTSHEEVCQYQCATISSAYCKLHRRNNSMSNLKCDISRLYHSNLILTVLKLFK